MKCATLFLHKEEQNGSYRGSANSFCDWISHIVLFKRSLKNGVVKTSSGDHSTRFHLLTTIGTCLQTVSSAHSCHARSSKIFTPLNCRKLEWFSSLNTLFLVSANAVALLGHCPWLLFSISVNLRSHFPSPQK